MSDNQYFTASPFNATANKDASTFWSGRSGTLRKVERKIRGLASRSDSTLDLIWANFGAGKSHTLFYIANKLSPERNVCVTFELPEQVRNFLDVYKAIASQWPYEKFIDHIIDCTNDDVPPDLHSAARIIRHGKGREKECALQWLRADRPHLGELKRLTGINKRIESDVEAIGILSGVIRALSDKDIRVCCMLDEFQRMGRLSERNRSLITSSIRTLFNENPNYFSLFIGITSRIEETAMAYIPQELVTLLGARPSISLPTMNQGEAKEFVKARLEHFRPEGFSEEAFAPFGEPLVELVISYLEHRGVEKLTPRELLNTLGVIFEEISTSPEDFQTEAAARETLNDIFDTEWFAEADVGS